METQVNDRAVCVVPAIFETPEKHGKHLQEKGLLSCCLKESKLLKASNPMDLVPLNKVKNTQSIKPSTPVCDKRSPIFRECCNNVAFIVCTKPTKNQDALSRHVLLWHELESQESQNLSGLIKSPANRKFSGQCYDELLKLDTKILSLNNEHEIPSVPCCDMVIFYPTKVKSRFMAFLRKHNKKICQRTQMALAKVVSNV